METTVPQTSFYSVLQCCLLYICTHTVRNTAHLFCNRARWFLVVHPVRAASRDAMRPVCMFHLRLLVELRITFLFFPFYYASFHVSTWDNYVLCQEKYERHKHFAPTSANMPRVEQNFARSRPEVFWLIVAKFHTISSYHLTDFQFLQIVVTYLSYRHDFLTTHNARHLCHNVILLINKMLSKDDRVLAKVLKLEKGYGALVLKE